MNNYRIICYWPLEIWAVQQRIEKDGHTTAWMEVHRCTAKGEAGYKEIKKWIKENTR